MNRRMGLVRGLVLFVLIIAAIAALLGVTITDKNTPPIVRLDKVDLPAPHDVVYRFTDLEGTVTCWLYSHYDRGAGGISCITTESIQRVKE